MSIQAFPSAHSILLETSLYQEIPVEAYEDHWAAIDFLHFDGTYDSYCPQCKREATFKVVPPARPDSLKRNKRNETIQKQMGIEPDFVFAPPGVHRICAQCTRHTGHTQVFIFLIVQSRAVPSPDGSSFGTVIQKIGQHPSFADLHLAGVKKYASVLSRDRLSEFSRAIGLASHDVGIGAYVYLRRTFESLVEEAHQSAKHSPEWDEDTYQRSRMAEKIALLKSLLPTFLVEHPQMYSLLSKGVHELTEQECLTHFDTLRVGIELMLDEKIQKKERESKIAKARTALSKAVEDSGT